MSRTPFVVVKNRKVRDKKEPAEQAGSVPRGARNRFEGRKGPKYYHCLRDDYKTNVYMSCIAATRDCCEERKRSSKIDPSRFRRGKYKGRAAGRLHNIKVNPLHVPIARKEPLKQTGILLVKDDLTAMLGKRRSTRTGTLSLRFDYSGRNRLIISNGQLRLVKESTPQRAYNKNMDFLLASRRSRLMSFLAHSVTEIGISRRMFMRMRHASHLSWIGQSLRAAVILRSLANEYSKLRRTAQPVLRTRSHPMDPAS